MIERDIMFEESLSDVWDERDCGVSEVLLDERPLTHVGLAVMSVGLVVVGQLIFLNIGKRDFYAPRAEANLGYAERVPAPRGVITDRFGTVIAENRAVFSALLDIREFLKQKELQTQTLGAIARILAIPSEEVWRMVRERDLERSADPLVLESDITHAELVAIREMGLPTLRVADAFLRTYPEGPVFSALLGYVGLVTRSDLMENDELTGRDVVGKTGIERQYDALLRGVPGKHVTLRDANGNVLGEQDEQAPAIGKTLALTIDAEFQKYFYARFAQALHDLGRTSGAGLAINPRNGEVLALASFPSFDNNVFVGAGKNAERSALLVDEKRPLFNRAVGGEYNPGSTIKPLVGVAALAENVISPGRTVFSPGYLDIPNPYDPSNPTRFDDWRYQGDVNLADAIAQSSNVYFYTVGGGANSVKGLGIERLTNWWKKFGLGAPTGIDMPGEADGFLPGIEWKEKAAARPWFLGDTYNASIGQGDLVVTPLQLLSYIGAIANGGNVYAPHVGSTAPTRVTADLTAYLPQIQEVQFGMRKTVTGALGTAHLMNDLPFEVSAKTGSAQVKNNREENAFFVGYAPSDDPQIAILVLVENSKQGSLNAVPIAKDAFAWYYARRMREKAE